MCRYFFSATWVATMSRMKSEGPASTGERVSAGLFSVIIKCRTESNRDPRQCPIPASASVLREGAFFVADLHCAGQRERENLGGISQRLNQTRHDDIGVEHDFHFRRRARRAAPISASISDMDKLAVPLAAAACWSADCAWSARMLRKRARVDSMEAAAMGRSTATGWPLEVMTRSCLPADFNHAPAGFFFNSLMEIVLTAGKYLGRATHASASAPIDLTCEELKLR